MGHLCVACALGCADRVTEYLNQDPTLIETTVEPYDAISTGSTTAWILGIHSARAVRLTR